MIAFIEEIENNKAIANWLQNEIVRFERVLWVYMVHTVILCHELLASLHKKKLVQHWRLLNFDSSNQFTVPT